jgi:biopolymer transport protein ExbD
VNLAGSRHRSSGSTGRYAAPQLAEINIIPLVDVILVILIIFLVTMSFDRPKPAEKPTDPVFQLPITLPQSNAATEANEAGPVLVLGVDQHGRKYVGASPATTETVIQKVREAARKNPATRVRIDADRSAKYLDVVELIEMCQFEGLRNVGLHTANKDD